MFKGKCPRCRKGNVFTNKFYNPIHFDKTNTFCPICKVKFEHETGFFWGAMYFSYALNTAITIATCIVLFVVFNDPSLEVYAVTIILTALLFTPILLRLSRLLMMYFIAPYRKYVKNDNWN